MKTSQNARISQLIGIPLQTKMIGDIFYDKLDSKEEFSKTKLVNLADLYHEFIETKIKIQVEEKNEQKISRDQDDFEERKKC